MRATKFIASALLAAAPVRAEPVEIEAGGAHVTFGTPRRESTFAAAVSLGVGTTLDTTFDATLRGHVTMGDGFVTALGPHLRQRIGARAFLGYGPAIASVVGRGDRSTRASGIGLAADLRAGIHIGGVSFTVEALPIWVFASDSPTTQIGYAYELGVAVGYQR